MNIMFVVLGQPQVILVQADGFLIFEQYVDVFFSEFIWNLQVATSCNFVSGQLGLGSVQNIALNRGADFGGCVIHEWVELVILNLHESHDIISLNGDLVRSAVF